LKVGVIVTSTGVGAYLGEQSLKGIEFALEEINNTGGVNGRKVEIVVEDSKTEPAAAVNAINKLINVDGVHFIIGDSWTSTTASMVPVANKNEVILISPIATLDDLAQDDFFFRTLPTIKNLMQPLAEYLYENKNVRTVAFLRSDTPFGVEHVKDFTEAFVTLGGTVVAEEGFPISSTDVRSQIAKVKLKNPDAIFNLHASGPRVGLLIRQAQELNVNPVWIGTYASENDALIKEYSNEIEGLIYPYPYIVDPSNPSAQKFIESFTQKYNEYPDLTVVNSYDAFKILLSAINSAGEDPYAIKKYLLNMSNYQGASGTLSFDENGDVLKPIFIKEVHEGKFIQAQ